MLDYNDVTKVDDITPYLDELVNNPNDDELLFFIFKYFMSLFKDDNNAPLIAVHYIGSVLYPKQFKEFEETNVSSEEFEEIVRSILQRVEKKYEEENTKLKEENTRLKEKYTQLKEEYAKRKEGNTKQNIDTTKAFILEFVLILLIIPFLMLSTSFGCFLVILWYIWKTSKCFVDKEKLWVLYWGGFTVLFVVWELLR